MVDSILKWGVNILFTKPGFKSLKWEKVKILIGLMFTLINPRKLETIMKPWRLKCIKKALILKGSLVLVSKSF